MVKVEDVLKEVLEEVRPRPETVAKTRGVAEMLVKSLEEVFGVGKVSLEGSFKKGTMVRGREEVDIFIHFTPSTHVEDAARQVLEHGSRSVEVLGGSVRLRYASHPYVEGFVDGIRVNIVPCYDTEPGRWITPVDRTPYHTRYIHARLTDKLADEVRLLKAFLMNDGLYGAEIRIRGFSGYACELLILRYGSFLQLLTAASRWRPPVIVDGEAKTFPEQPITLPDPVDQARNVTAAVSLTTLSKFILKSKLFLNKPSSEYFMFRQHLPEMVEDRCFIGLLFDVPEHPPDVLWGELGKTMQGLYKTLSTHGFRIYRCGSHYEGEKALIIYELESLTLPKTYLHVGPPVWSESSVEFLKEQMRKTDLAAPPWVEGDRVFSTRRRKHTEAVSLLRSEITEDKTSASKTLRPYLKRCEIYSDVNRLGEVLTAGLRNFLMEFVGTCPAFIASYILSQ